jgi:hypothetical protein
VPTSTICGAIPPLPQNVFMAWCLVKHRDNFISLLYYIQYSITVFSDCKTLYMNIDSQVSGVRVVNKIILTEDIKFSGRIFFFKLLFPLYVSTL